MADEVTKKDLQSLQGYCNKQIAELAKRVEKAEGAIAILKDIPTAQDEAIAKLMNARCDKLEGRLAELAVKIAALEKG
jgi:hypothetical protein